MVKYAGRINLEEVVIRTSDTSHDWWLRLGPFRPIMDGPSKGWPLGMILDCEQGISMRMVPVPGWHGHTRPHTKFLPVGGKFETMAVARRALEPRLCTLATRSGRKFPIN